MEKNLSLKTSHLAIGWLGIFVGLLGLIGSVSLVLQSSGLTIRALPEEMPQELKLTNLTENSVSASWVTTSATVASLVYSTFEDLSASSNSFDDRGANTTSTIHLITLSNLKPDTLYYFRLICGGGTFDNQGKPYTFKTAAHISLTPPPPFVIKGKTGQEALVYFSFNDSTSLSTLSDENGNYLLSLNNALTKNLQNYYPVQKGEKGYLLVNDGKTKAGGEIVVEEEMTLTGVAAGKDLQTMPKTLVADLPNPEKTSLLVLLQEKLKGIFGWLGGLIR